MIKEQVITNRGGVFDAENIITGGIVVQLSRQKSKVFIMN